MKLALVVALCCLALHHGHGAPRTAVYKYLKCNPDGDQANCVTYQSPKMAWSSDLPDKIPASEAKNLEAEAVEDEEPSQVEKEEPLDKEEVMMQDEEDEDQYLEDDYEEELIGDEYEGEMVVKEDEDDFEDEEEEEEEEEEDDMMGKEDEMDTMPSLGEEGESPLTFLSEDGSGSEEGSGGGVADQLFRPFERNPGSGESPKEEEANTVRHLPHLRDILKWSLVGTEKPAEEELKEDHLMNA